MSVISYNTTDDISSVAVNTVFLPASSKSLKDAETLISPLKAAALRGLDFLYSERGLNSTFPFDASNSSAAFSKS